MPSGRFKKTNRDVYADDNLLGEITDIIKK
jgi:hypothetical protein